MKTLGKCKLCEQQRELQKSHAIGNAVFKKLFKTMSGKGIFLSKDDKPIQYSSDSWAEPQLCKECEHFLNIEFERYSLTVLRGQKGFVKSSGGISFNNIDQSKLIKYFLSVYYRAALSSHKAYSGIRIIKAHHKLLKRVFNDSSKLPSSEFHIKLSRVVDMSNEKGFSDESIKEIICAPFCRLDTVRKGSITVCFMFEGFFVEIFITGMKIKDRNLPGVLNKNKPLLFVPYVDLFSLDGVIDLMVDNLDKYQQGNHNIKH
ncbi:hypothetical protein LPA49_20130 [Pseudoalteromonas sp. MB41]|uniref:hypothetical protein n=1 Tax=Pseudoalteromonas sp. MB41 TaxID=2896366 RepID=UPI001E45C0BC|nr:hypothetical protein [Pseudoalteromonas sp. MB41]MCC9662855.1 hypothetical protein [Pseudoalteromonas sp. MB41]